MKSWGGYSGSAYHWNQARQDRADARVIYAASLALLPFIVFNQQVLTGRTMQAFHYEIFVVNYSTLVGLLIIVSLFLEANSSPFLDMDGGLVIGVGNYCGGFAA